MGQIWSDLEDWTKGEPGEPRASPFLRCHFSGERKLEVFLRACGCIS